MPTYTVKSRTTGPLVVATIDAVNREGAVDQVIKSIGPDETVEVLQVDEEGVDAANPSVAAKR